MECTDLNFSNTVLRTLGCLWLLFHLLVRTPILPVFIFSVLPSCFGSPNMLLLLPVCQSTVNCFKRHNIIKFIIVITIN